MPIFPVIDRVFIFGGIGVPNQILSQAKLSYILSGGAAACGYKEKAFGIHIKAVINVICGGSGIAAYRGKGKGSDRSGKFRLPQITGPLIGQEFIRTVCRPHPLCIFQADHAVPVKFPRLIGVHIAFRVKVQRNAVTECCRELPVINHRAVRI